MFPPSSSPGVSPPSRTSKHRFRHSLFSLLVLHRHAQTNVNDSAVLSSSTAPPRPIARSPHLYLFRLFPIIADTSCTPSRPDTIPYLDRRHFRLRPHHHRHHHHGRVTLVRATSRAITRKVHHVTHLPHSLARARSRDLTRRNGWKTRFVP